MEELQLVAQQDIDKVKWNSCVHYAINSNIYGYMWYLNNTAKEWDALIEGDYESVFPLIRDDKGQYYIPPLVSSAGIYSIHVLSPPRLKAFSEALAVYGKGGELVFNEGQRPYVPEGWEAETIHNHMIWLEPAYEALADTYSKGMRIKLERASTARLRAAGTLKPERIMQFFQQHAQEKNNLNTRFHAGHRIIYNALHRGWVKIAGITSEEGELLACASFLYSPGKITALLPAVSKKGQSLGADALLMDQFFMQHAGKQLLFDLNTIYGDWDSGFLTTLTIQTTPVFKLTKKSGFWQRLGISK